MKKGFTLSEVLITLGIVGIVAVLTIPGVMKNYKNRLYTAQLEKTYAQISDAAQAIMNDEHVDNFYETTVGQANSCSNPSNGVCEKGYGYFFSKYFKTLRYNCRTSDDKGCVTKKANFYKSIGGTNITDASDSYCVQTTSGAAICGNFNNAIGGDPSRKCLTVMVDVNGIAAPNTPGRDIFSMDIHDDGTISDYGSGCWPNTKGVGADKCTLGDTTNLHNAASGCLNNIIEAGWKMEY